MANTVADIVLLLKSNGKSVVKEWLEGIRDKTVRARIDRQIDKLAIGIGDQKQLQVVAELKIDIGPGFRVYYAFLDSKTIVVLLWAGDKSSQKQDIESARQLWHDFEQNGRPDAALMMWKDNQNERNEAGEF